MATIVQRNAGIQDRLLSALSEADQERLAAHFQTVSLQVDQIQPWQHHHSRPEGSGIGSL